MTDNEISRVSVVIPCYDVPPAYLIEAVESALAQSYQMTDVVIVDDGSSKNDTLSCLDSLALRKRVSVLHQRNAGPSAARNRAIDSTRAKYILPLDGDDLLVPDYVERAVEILDSNADIAVVYGGAEYFGERSGVMELPDYSLRTMLIRNCIFSGAVFRRNDWESVGGYDVEFRAGLEDYEFWLRLLKFGREVHRLPGTVYRYRVRSGSRNDLVHRDRDAYVQSMARVFARNYEAYLRHPDVLFLHQEHMRSRLIQYDERFGPLAAAAERWRIFGACLDVFVEIFRFSRRVGLKKSR